MNGSLVTCEVDMKKFITDIDKLERGLDPMAITATTESIYHIHQKAMENLNIGLLWGHGIDKEQSIENSKVIETSREGNSIKGTLTYTSPHASFIEYGGSYFVYNPKVMPIGKQEGNIVGYSHRITVNYPGKFFLTNAVISEEDKIREIFEGYLSNLINEFNLG